MRDFETVVAAAKLALEIIGKKEIALIFVLMCHFYIPGIKFTCQANMPDVLLFFATEMIYYVKLPGLALPPVKNA